MSLHLEKQLLFYGSYHHDPVNVWIHIICVPLILATFITMGTIIPSIPTPEAITIPYLPLDVPSVVAAIYAALYVLMEPVAGSVFGVMIMAWTAYSHYLTTTYGMTAVWWSVGVNLASWISQFIGHGVFEGRAPALLDNLVQALFLAPFFVWLELLFMLGYRPELKSRLDSAVQKELEKLNRSKNAKAVNGHTNGGPKTG